MRDIEYDEAGGADHFMASFHTMAGYNRTNQMTPSDVDLFATLTRLAEVKGIDYGILHTLHGGLDGPSLWARTASRWTTRSIILDSAGFPAALA